MKNLLILATALGVGYLLFGDKLKAMAQKTTPGGALPPGVEPVGPSPVEPLEPGNDTPITPEPLVPPTPTPSVIPGGAPFVFPGGTPLPVVPMPGTESLSDDKWTYQCSWPGMDGGYNQCL